MKPARQNITIKTIGAAHSAVLAQLHAACFSHPWSADALVKLFNMPGASGLIATLSDNENAAVGFALISNMGEEAEILTLCVLPENQRQNIGTRLLSAIHESCVASNTACVFLEVNAQDTGAVTFYSKSGYQHVGTRANYYKQGKAPADDALIMRHILEGV